MYKQYTAFHYKSCLSENAIQGSASGAPLTFRHQYQKLRTYQQFSTVIKEMVGFTSHSCEIYCIK